MRIAIASDDGTHVAAHTGRCKGFVIYDDTDAIPQRLEYRPNAATAHARGLCHEHGEHQERHKNHSHAPLLELLVDCSVLVAGGLGKRLRDDLASFGIRVVVSNLSLVEAVAQQYCEGRLKSSAGGGACHHAET